MDLHSMSRKLVVLAFAAALLAGGASAANAIDIDLRPVIRLVDDEEALGKPGNEMMSIGDANAIQVTVNVASEASVVVLDVSPKIGTNIIGGPFVEITADVTDTSGVEQCWFRYKPTDSSGPVVTLTIDTVAPYAYMWGDTFSSVTSGWYDIIAEVKDLGGNTTIAILTVYIDHCDPYGGIAQINDDQTPDGSNFFGVITITGSMQDSDSDCEYEGQLIHSGMAGAQFQYRTDGGWEDLGGFIAGEGPTFTIDWDTGAMVGDSVDLRIAGLDDAGNWGYSDYVTIDIIDTVADKAVIAGVDPVTGYVWAAAVVHGTSEDIGSVRFEYSSDGQTWTVIGEVDTGGRLFGVPWHTGGLAGTYWVRAVAYHDDWDPENPDLAGLYDDEPAMMEVTIAADGTTTMATTDDIRSLRRRGNLDRCEWVAVEVVSTDKPTLLVVYDSDPEDHFNPPSGLLRNLERPDADTVWVDDFDLDAVDPWGNVTIIATHNDEGIVGAKTSTLKVYKVNGEEGTKGAVSQDGMTVDIPGGAVETSDGLLMINVPELIADPSIDDPIAVGGPVMMTLLDRGTCDTLEFANGVRAMVCMEYDEADIPLGYEEADLRIAFWHRGRQEWIFEGHDVEIVNPVVDTDSNTVCVYVNQTGTYSVVATKPLRITTPVFDPRCACVASVCYTSVYPMFCSIIEDLRYDYIDEIKVVLNGPAGDVIYDNMTIYSGSGRSPVLSNDGGCFETVKYGAGWYGSYDGVTHRLCMRLIPEQSWSDYWGHWWEEYEDWLVFYGDLISDGLPGGTYTLDIYAQNGMGDEEHITYTFRVDATPPRVIFAGHYVAADPSFNLMVKDSESGVDTTAIFLDIYGVKPDNDECCDHDTEHEDYLGTATPTAMVYDPVAGGYSVTFGYMAFGRTLADGMSIDVIVYDGTYTTSDCEYGECRQYHTDDGVYDCAGNHANPVWRRFTVDLVPPSMEIVSDEGASKIEIRICDEGAGIDDGNFMVNGVTLSGTTYDWTWTPTSQTCGILRIDIGLGAVDIDITATDKAGNFETLEITTSSDAVQLVDVKSYPNPFDPDEGATILYTLSKDAHVVVAIYDFAGEHVKTLVDEWKHANTYTKKWMGDNGKGETVASGAYIGYVKADDGSKTVMKNIKIGVVKRGND